MKKLFSILLLSCLAANVYAQQLSGGIRLGSTFWTNIQKGTSIFESGIPGQNASITKSVFARYASKKRWAFELGFSHDQLKSTDVYEQGCFGPEYYTTSDYTMKYYGVNMSVQYDITCSHLRSCAVMKKFKNYIGVVVNPTYIDMHTYTHAMEGYPPHESSNYNLQVWTGLSNNIVYQFNENISLSSVCSFQLEPGQYLSIFNRGYPSTSATRFTFQVGAAYKL